MPPIINSGDVHRMFKKLDKNGDGQVSIDELKWLLDRVDIHMSSSDQLETLVGRKTLDLVDFWIFYDIFIMIQDQSKDEINDDENKISEEDLKKSFEIFDKNGDRFISCEELQSTLSRLGLWDEQCGRDCRSMIEFYDCNADGLLDVEEFKSMMLLNNIS